MYSSLKENVTLTKREKSEENQKQVLKTMNGFSLVDPNYSEFVEVDPCGRYGRVSLSFSILHFCEDLV